MPRRISPIGARLACALDDAAARSKGAAWATRAGARWSDRAGRLRAERPSDAAALCETIAAAYGARAFAIACRETGDVERALRLERLSDGLCHDADRIASHMRPGAESPTAADVAALRRVWRYRHAYAL
jgi:hypothetical protein